MPNSYAYLTGKWRFRLNWRGKAILQVEHQYEKSYNLGADIEIVDVQMWKDAKQREIYYLQSAGYFSPGTGFKGLKI